MIKKNPMLNAVNTFYKNLYPQMSGSGGTGVPWKWGRIGSVPGATVNLPKLRSALQGPAGAMYAQYRRRLDGS